MADNDHVSSTTPLFGGEVHHYEAEPDKPKQDLFSMDDIVDLVGGAQDALDRHLAEGRAPHESTEDLYPSSTLAEPEPVPVPGVTERDPGTAIPDSTSFASVLDDIPPLIAEKPDVVAPKVEPESSQIEPEPQAAPGPEAAPQIDALPAADPWKAAPASAEAAERPAVTEEPPAPASYEPSPSKAQPHPLMQFPTALGQKGESPAPISPLSPLHSPDSLEELSLTESPNQPPTSGFAASLGSFSTAPPTTHSKDMAWVGEEGGSGPGRSQIKEDPLAGPYLSLGKDPGPHNPCEDSGVSVSPEEKLISSDRSPTGPSPLSPQVKVPESQLASSNPTEHWDSPYLASQDNTKVPPMDAFSKDTAPFSSSRYDQDLHDNHSDEDDDLMYEVKKNNNPFEGYSPLADSGYSHFGDFKSDNRASKISESPTPDLVLYGQTGESQDAPPSFLDEKKTFQTGNMAADSLMQSVNRYSSGLKDDDEDDDDEEEEEEEDSAAVPTSLPDILKSSPLNPDKLDSGSSEGSPEQSPILERRMMESPNPPINLSANNPFAFDAKVSLLKEMTEELEVKGPEKVKAEDDPGFGAFDLVKEAAETSPSEIKDELPVKIEQKDWFSSHDAQKVKEQFEPLDFQGKKTPAEDSDSESPTADSLSPVLEAMAKNPASFQVETEKMDPKMELEEPEMAEEVSEHEISSEEFEFIERPPRGVIDEFLEALDTSKFASSKPPEIPMDDDLSFGHNDVPPFSAPFAAEVAAPPEAEAEAPSQSSYRLLTQTSPQKSKAELEKPDVQQPPAQAPPIHSAARKPDEAVAVKSAEGGKVFKMPNVNIRAVVDLLYWRDVKRTGVVFGAALLLLLSLTVCSIVSVCSYIGLALLSVTICFRIYKGILQAIQKSDEGHPFKQYLDQEVALSEDVVHKYSDLALAKLNKTVCELRRLFLVEDLIDSIKFAGLMWILTYVGSLFNGLTILILVLIGVFSCPIVYEKHQTQIDHYVALVNNQVKDVVGKVQAKVPGMKRKAE
ncbi:reticulon-4a isoform X1 [Pungitius pungitius]|uniref:reticulon-4a isoform X1 n=1 Tax=Pungitius pungitius TaxID=134920 RepID=UPI002E139475